ncbi:TonB-dependent receptor [Congregibacter sp.]|uniref:TonB-dependent receptor n=1 Tax=Congregibacter sp. TaxID=2744308 RepID=UPI003F6D2693
MKQDIHAHARKLLFVALAGISASATQAQNVLEEVIVTAQKRETTLSETPVAITAISDDQIIALGIYSAQDVANFTPSMSYQETAGGGEGNRIYLRGIGRETSTTGTEPGVGVYNNGFYTAESGALSQPVDIIERLEVLRGPQGTLFGRNTTGGAINAITKKPGDEYEHIVRGRAGNYNSSTLALTSSGPITDSIGYLVHYSQLDSDSFYENVSGPDPIGRNSDYIEAQLDFDITDRINWNVRYFSASFENETLERAKLDGYRNEPGAPSKLGELVINPELFAPVSVAPDQSDPFKRSLDFNGSVAVDDQQTYHSTLTIDFDSFSVRLLNGYQDYSWEGAKDFDGTASPASYIETIGQAETTTQHEIQFVSNGDGSVDWLFGMFYLKNELDQPYTLNDPNNPYLINNVSGVPNPDGIFYFQTGILEVESKAIYGQVDWAVNDRLTLSAGLRYSEDDKEGYEAQSIFYDSVLDFCGEFLLPITIGTGNPYFTIPECPRVGVQIADLEANQKGSWDAVNWRLNASYELGEDSMAYATVSTGYKPGGFRLGGLQDDPATPENESIVDNEELTAYELGYKGSLGGSWSVSSALFFYDYSDIQVELDILDPRTGIVTSQLANASSADVYGFELESTWLASEKLTVIGNYSYLSSEYTDDFFVSDNKSNEIRNVKGNELNRTPNNKFTLAALYAQPIGDGTLLFSGNYSWIDEQYVTVFNDDIETIDSYEQLNGRVTWQPASGRYQVALYGVNLTDELSFANDFAVSALADGVRRSGRPINPRTYGLEVAIFF